MAGPTFARLVLLFDYIVPTSPEKPLLLALVHPYAAPPSTTYRQRDKDLSLYRVRRELRSASYIILAQSIIRGARLIPDYARHPPSDYALGTPTDQRKVDGEEPENYRNQKEYFVDDLIDADMFLRMKQTDYVGKQK